MSLNSNIMILSNRLSDANFEASDSHNIRKQLNDLKINSRIFILSLTQILNF